MHWMEEAVWAQNVHVFCITVYGIVSAKRDLPHAFSKIYLVSRVSITYFLALKIGLSIMELQWPEFLITRTFQLHTSTLMLSHWKNCILSH